MKSKEKLNSDIETYQQRISSNTEQVGIYEDQIRIIDEVLACIDEIIQPNLNSAIGSFIDSSCYEEGASSRAYDQGSMRWAGTTFYSFQQQVDGDFESNATQNACEGDTLMDLYTIYNGDFIRVKSSVKRARDRVQGLKNKLEDDIEYDNYQIACTKYQISVLQQKK